MSTGIWLSLSGSGCRDASLKSPRDAEAPPPGPVAPFVGPKAAPLSVPPSLCAASARRRSDDDAGDAGDRVVFTDSTFEDLYPYFLRRRIPEGLKATLWLRCAERWVRWSGRIVSFTAQGITLKQLDQTMTFDVSLLVDMPGRAQLEAGYKVGDQVTYLGRLDHFDDLFRTVYLVHGQIVKKDPSGPDLGVLRRVP